MKRTFLISYDLGMPETSTDYKKIISYINSLGAWAKPLKSQWFVVTEKTADEILNDLISLTDANDEILVLEVSNDYWVTYGIDSEITNWMINNI